MKAPRILYKYTSASTANIVLSSGRLRWSNPSQFNDLNEFQIMPRFSPSLEEDWEPYLLKLTGFAYNENLPNTKMLSQQTLILLSLLRLIKSSVKSEKEMLNKIIMEFPSNNNVMEDLLRVFTKSIKNEFAKVFCLTSSPTNDVMWAHYANNHSGCVLGFRQHLNSPFSEARPVKYSDGIPIVGTGLDFLLYGDGQELRQKTIEAIYYTKQIRWAYEEEWRAITWRNDEEGKNFGDYKFYAEELESITFGPRVNHREKNCIINIMRTKYNAAKIYEVVNENGNSRRVLINA